MVRFTVLVAFLGLLVGTPAVAQEISTRADFLTEFEADLIRKAQEPRRRVPQYLEFAKLRIALIDQLLAKDELGRGAKIHKNLDELGRIIESIDMVIDDALVREADLEKVIPELLVVEQDLLSRLEEIQDSDNSDLWRYEFVLEDAIDILADSIEITSDDPMARRVELVEAEANKKSARQATMTESRRAEMNEAEEAADEEVRKRPSLLKEGETLEGQEKGRIF